MNDETFIKWPTRSRPRLFFETLTHWYQDDSTEFLITIDADDGSMNNPEVRGRLANMSRVSYRVGNSRGKVEAINDGVAEAEWDFLILGSDDMLPQRPDYAKYIRHLFDQKFPDGDGVLHLNDGRTGKTLNTLPILDRRYFDRTGRIYSSAYQSLFCDDEFQAVSESLGRAVYVDEVVIRHAFTDATGADSLHCRNESFYRRDEEVFQDRKRRGFPKE